jgi:hypothetical protein
MTDRELVADYERVINRNLEIRSILWRLEIRIDHRRYRAYETMDNNPVWATSSISNYLTAKEMAIFLAGYHAAMQNYFKHLDITGEYDGWQHTNKR